MTDPFQAYQDYYERLNAENVEDLYALVSPDFHFVDPFNDVRGADKVVAVFKRMFKHLRDPQFKIIERAITPAGALAVWTFSFSHRFLNGGRPISFSGVSKVRANQQGQIVEHLDYWDSASQVLVHLPLIGRLFRLVGKLL